MEKVILVLDKLDYKKKESAIKDAVGNDFDVRVYYTAYEDALIRRVCKWKYVGEILLHILYWLKSLNYALDIYFHNSGCRIVCINPIVGVFLGMLNRGHKFSITIGGFLFEPKKNKFYYNLRKKVVKVFLQGLDTVIVYAAKEIKYYEKIFGVKKFKFVKYGIDYDAHKPYEGNVPSNYIFSGGRSNRDFHNLIAAYEMLKKDYSDLELCIATRPVVLQNEQTDNITVLKDVVLETFGSAMEKAEFVVLPLIETEISAGHQVLLEALERNMIVLISKIDAVTDYVSGEQVIFYNPGDKQDLYTKMKYIYENIITLKEKYKNNASYYKANYGFVQFIDRVIRA